MAVVATLLALSVVALGLQMRADRRVMGLLRRRLDTAEEHLEALQKTLHKAYARRERPDRIVRAGFVMSNVRQGVTLGSRSGA